MGLVHGRQADARFQQAFDQDGRRECLGRRHHQQGAALLDAVEGLLALVAADAPIQTDAGNVTREELLVLVLKQGEQR